MITDNQTDLLYLADCLPKKFPNFSIEFEKVLTKCKIKYEWLPKTKDIWAVDYMPIQVSEKEFVQFVYRPDYLLKYPSKLKTISDGFAICKEMGFTPTQSNIILDGGNVIKTVDKVIMTDKIFAENPNISKVKLESELRNWFKVDKIYFIPFEPRDEIGHADGMVRFYNDNTVLINKSIDKNSDFEKKLKTALNNAELMHIEIPYNLDRNRSSLQAIGIYINFLQMKNVIIVPTFGINEDDEAIRQFEELFKGQKVESIDSSEIAKKGGILNCITWNIKALN